MGSFHDSIEQMLWPEKRDKDRSLGRQGAGRDRPHDHHGAICEFPKAFLPDFLQDVVELEEQILPDVRVLPPIFKDSGIEIGPIPKGTPVNLLTNLNMLPDDAGFIERFTHKRKIVKLLIKIKTGAESASPECHRRRGTEGLSGERCGRRLCLS